MIRGTREWAVAEINCSIGCPHDCRYCYARAAALRHGVIERAEQWPEMRRDETTAAKRHPRYPGQVMFPAAHDIVEENLDDCLAVIQRLLACGNRVLVVSKPTRRCIEAVCKRFSGYREQLLFRFTVTCRHDAILSFWEPGAPAYEERCESLERTYAAGFATSVSIEPMLERHDVVRLIAELEPLVTHSIWLGTMNDMRERVAMTGARMRREAARIREERRGASLAALYRELRDNPRIRWKESIKQVVGLPLNTRAGLDR